MAEIDRETIQELKDKSFTNEAVDLLTAFLRRIYYIRIDVLKRKRDHADVELKKVCETRQSLIEKNLNGTYSDDIFKEQIRSR